MRCTNSNIYSTHQSPFVTSSEFKTMKSIANLAPLVGRSMDAYTVSLFVHTIHVFQTTRRRSSNTHRDPYNLRAGIIDIIRLSPRIIYPFVSDTMFRSLGHARAPSNHATKMGRVPVYYSIGIPCALRACVQIKHSLRVQRQHQQPRRAGKDSVRTKRQSNG